MSKQISIIGVPMDFGQLHRGVDMGPAAIRYSGLVSNLRSMGHTVFDMGDVPVPVRDSVEHESHEKNLNIITKVCESVYAMGKKVIENNQFPIFLGGDHSISIGTVGAVSHKEPSGLIWIDAHGDFNTNETSPSGNIHGMPLATLVGDGHESLVNIGKTGAKINPENIVMIAQRDLDDQEKKRLKKLGIMIFTMRDIDEQGISSIANKTILKFAHMKRIHLTIDMDALDPIEAPGVGTPVPGGITYREAHLLMEILADSGKLTSMDLVEINPILDQRNKTAHLAVELALSALGKRIM